MQPSGCGALWYWQQQVLDTLVRRRHGSDAFVVRAVYVRSSFHLSFELDLSSEQRGCIDLTASERISCLLKIRSRYEKVSRSAGAQSPSYVSFFPDRRLTKSARFVYTSTSLLSRSTEHYSSTSASLPHQELDLLLVLTSHGVCQRCHSVLVLRIHSRSQRNKGRDHHGMPPISGKVKRRSTLFVLKTRILQKKAQGLESRFHFREHGTSSHLFWRQVPPISMVRLCATRCGVSTTFFQHIVSYIYNHPGSPRSG